MPVSRRATTVRRVPIVTPQAAGAWMPAPGREGLFMFHWEEYRGSLGVQAAVTWSSGPTSPDNATRSSSRSRYRLTRLPGRLVRTRVGLFHGRSMTRSSDLAGTIAGVVTGRGPVRGQSDRRAR